MQLVSSVALQIFNAISKNFWYWS